MTLDTKVYLRGPITPRAAFESAICAVLKAAGREGESAKVAERDGRLPSDDGVSTMFTEPGQGLPAWTWCSYRTDGPLAAEDDFDTADGEPYLVRPACDVEVSWDTAYSYNDNGLGCTQLHVLALIELNRVLPEGVTFLWQNEYTGEYHEGLNGLDGFLGSGMEAASWFNGTVRPLIDRLVS